MSTATAAAERTKQIAKAVERMRSVDLSYMPVYPGGQKRFNKDCQVLAAAYLALAPAEDEQPLDEAWLRSIGFRTKQYQGGAPLALKIHGGPIADPQWIETTDRDGEFLICRWSPMYDDDTPPDRISVTANNRRELLSLLTALNASILLASDAEQK